MAEREELVALLGEPAAFLGNEDPLLRRMATTALGDEACTTEFDTVVALLNDDHASVRAVAAERLGSCGEPSLTHLAGAAGDPDPRVREAVATAYGHIADPVAIPWLIGAGETDSDRTVREAAVAALGSIGDAAAIDPLLEFVAKGPPQVRRRAIAAITVFDDPRVEPAIRRAALDRNPGVREAAEMVVGKQLTAQD